MPTFVPSIEPLHAQKSPAAQTIALRGGASEERELQVKVGRFNIDVDANHPLAGQALTFDVEVMAVRDATAEERAHGHAHGPGGAQH